MENEFLACYGYGVEADRQTANRGLRPICTIALPSVHVALVLFLLDRSPLLPRALYAVRHACHARIESRRLPHRWVRCRDSIAAAQQTPHAGLPSADACSADGRSDCRGFDVVPPGCVRIGAEASTTVTLLPESPEIAFPRKNLAVELCVAKFSARITVVGDAQESELAGSVMV